MQEWIRWLDQVSMEDLEEVGGKNASLGEMIRALGNMGVDVPGGFAVTASAFRHFLHTQGLADKIASKLRTLDVRHLEQLAQVGAEIRAWVMATPFPPEVDKAIRQAWDEMVAKTGEANLLVAVRSSATTEDLPGASFAGEHDTFLGVQGADAVVEAVRGAMASLFNDRAISYRHDQGFAEEGVALSVTVQQLVRSDCGASGVLFTVDPETGFQDLIVINGIWGLGELIVQGKVTPDEFLVFKPLLEKAPLPILGKHLGDKHQKMILGENTPVSVVPTTPEEQSTFVLESAEVVLLARWAQLIEEHYSERAGAWTPMDIEWAKDGLTGRLYVVQARPETVQVGKNKALMQQVRVEERGEPLCRGISVGQSAAIGAVRVIQSPKEMGSFQPGEVLVTSITDPDWEPIMRNAAAIVTDRGGRTSHAAIVSRELGVPAIVGTGDATSALTTGRMVTVDATEGVGVVYDGSAKIEKTEQSLDQIPSTKTQIMLNMATPDTAFQRAPLPVAGVGLAREEFIIAGRIGIHPLAALHLDEMPPEMQKEILHKARGWHDPVQFYVDTLAYGIAQIAAAFFPRKVIVRFSDFKTNEYRSLLGGDRFEPQEENPMLGWRGASRYTHPDFAPAFALECQALRYVREEAGLDNVIPMIPFCRTLEEAEAVLASMAAQGLVARSQAASGQKTLPVYMMCEIPSNVLLADAFLDLFDGFSIGSNDLTQLTLGLDRDSGMLSHLANEDHASVCALVSSVLETCRRRQKYIGICGQAPSDLPGFVRFLVAHGIESISLNPDAFFHTVTLVAQIERELEGSSAGSHSIGDDKKL